jgi:hypothetical protein
MTRLLLLDETLLTSCLLSRVYHSSDQPLLDPTACPNQRGSWVMPALRPGNLSRPATLNGSGWKLSIVRRRSHSCLWVRRRCTGVDEEGKEVRTLYVLTLRGRRFVTASVGICQSKDSQRWHRRCGLPVSERVSETEVTMHSRFHLSYHPITFQAFVHGPCHAVSTASG